MSYKILSVWPYDPTGLSHTAFVQEALKLNSEGYVELIEMYLPAVNESYYLRFTNQADIEWNGHTWEGIGIQITGINVAGAGEVNRPTLQVMNPAGIFSAYIAQGKLNRGTVTRYRVLARHARSGQVISLRQIWKIGRTIALNRDTVSLELKSFMDGHAFTIPARQFFPPEFTHVKLG